MNPGRPEPYNLLANLFFKKEDLEGCRKCLQDGLKQGKTKRGLRYMTLVIRGIGSGTIKDRFEQSIETAKEAVGLDLKDGFSWCNLTRHSRKFLLYDPLQCQTR